MHILSNPNFDIIGKRKIASYISIGLIVIGLVSLIIKAGPALGIDFTGGTLVQLKFEEPVDISVARANLSEQGFTKPTIQAYGSENEILIRVPTEEAGEDFAERIAAAFVGKTLEIRRTDFVGPKIGSELKGKSFQAVFAAMFGILLYITIRFDRYYAVGAVAALFHDVLITLGIFSLLNLELDLAIIAAFLTIVGYSLNDTIVVFDRIRENVKGKSKSDLFQIVNRSINQTLNRTIITSLTTFVVVLMLFLLGGEVIKYFAFALMVGVVVGTYSSIFVASPIMAFLELRAQAKQSK